MRSIAWPSVVVGLLVAPGASAGALDRFESSHAPSKSSPPPSSTSHSSSSSDSYSSSGSSSSGSLPPELLLVYVPAVWGAAFSPPNRPTLDPYDGTWVSPSSVEGEQSAPESRLRHAEVTIGGFVAPDDYVFSRAYALRLFLGKMVVSGSWDRMYETPPEPDALSRLDFYRLHLTSNLLGGSVRNVELYPQMGLALMQGRRSTWAFDAGLEARVYPRRPLAFALSSIASIFGQGPVLFDTRLEAGVTFDRIELRAGLRSLYQHGSQGFFGPIGSVIVRF